MEMYTKHFYFDFFDIFKYIKNVFQIKGAYAPGSKKASPLFSGATFDYFEV
jgi:hypothetical protein